MSNEVTDVCRSHMKGKNSSILSKAKLCRPESDAG